MSCIPAMPSKAAATPPRTLIWGPTPRLGASATCHGHQAAALGSTNSLQTVNTSPQASRFCHGYQAAATRSRTVWEIVRTSPEGFHVLHVQYAQRAWAELAHTE